MAGAKRAVLIAGPTASGKSALALARARELGGIVVNTDAMQVYDVLRVVTARPSAAEMAGVPHRLYGLVDPATRFSTGAWLAAAAQTIAESDGRPLIFAGGTGLYFDALERGFAEVPPVPADIVAGVERELVGLDAEAARGRLLLARDPEMAARLQAPDPQRVTRALAVLAATGQSLARFQDRTQQGLLDGFSIERIVLDPDRDVLRAAHRRAVWPHVRGWRGRGGFGAAGAAARSEPASNEGDRGPGDRRLACRRDEQGSGDRAGGDRDAAIWEAPAYVVS